MAPVSLVKSTNKKQPKNKKKRANKVHLVFDETKRREFLTGFHKRKQQRRKEAKEKLERDLKEERKRLKSEAKQSYKKLIASHRTIPELETLLKEEYQDGDATVQVMELSTDPTSRVEPKAENEEVKEEVENAEEEVPGMSLTHNFTSKKDVKRLLKKEATKKMQKSKVFQLKSKMEKRKQKKQSARAKNEKMKAMDKKRKKHKK